MIIRYCDNCEREIESWEEYYKLTLSEISSYNEITTKDLCKECKEAIQKGFIKK